MNNNWNSILTDTEKEIVKQKIDEIAEVLIKYDCTLSESLLHGGMGVSLFLFHHCFELDDERLYQQISKNLFYRIDKIYKLTLAINDPLKCEANIAQGFSGIGWAINYLINHQMIEGEIFEVMECVDPYLFRRMIYDTQKDRYSLLHGVIGAALYCQSRIERFPKEYLTRFILELYKRMCLGKLDVIDDYSIPTGLSGLYLLLLKIHKKYPNMVHVLKIIKRIEYKLKLQSVVLKNTQATQPGWSQQELGLLWSQMQIQEIQDIVLGRWYEYGKLHLKSKGQYLESGLYGGSFSLGHLFNRVYQLSNQTEFKNLATEFFYRGLEHANYVDKQSGYKLWYTGMNETYGLHQGLLGGLAGIGLALLATISDNTPDWDEVLLIS